jgi:hypothetical protein
MRSNSSCLQRGSKCNNYKVDSDPYPIVLEQEICDKGDVRLYFHHRQSQNLLRAGEKRGVWGGIQGVG